MEALLEARRAERLRSLRGLLGDGQGEGEGLWGLTTSAYAYGQEEQQPASPRRRRQQQEQQRQQRQAAAQQQQRQAAAEHGEAGSTGALLSFRT